MVLLKAQRLQRLAEKLGRIESRLARASGEVEEAEAGEAGTAEAGADAAAGGEAAAAEPEAELEEAAARAGVELETLRRLDGATLERALSPGGRPDPGRFWAAAELLYLDAVRARAEGQADLARRSLQKARRLYRRADDGLDLPEGATPPAERLAAIEELKGERGDAGPEEP